MICKSRYFLPIFLFLPFLLILSCKKNETADTSPSHTLSFSTDTVYFDTVFTTVGSVTHRLLVYNTDKKKISISSVRLGGGSNSNFRINIDGQPSTGADNIEIEGNDSLFIFVKVTVDPTHQNLPLVISDSLIFSTNGNIQYVKLVAWGQDAIFHKDEDISGSNTWDSLKPHVIFGHLRVDTAGSLLIREGTKIYFHKSSYLAVSSQANLKVQGTKDHPVEFRGDRLDPYYRDLPGQWKGIWLEKGSTGNQIDYAVIRNGENGILVDSLSAPGTTMLDLNNTIIKNMSYNGLYAYSTSITSQNCVIGDCGSTAFTAEYGGSYDFRQLTIANYWGASVRMNPTVYLSNYTWFGNKKSFQALTKAYFGNSIIYGSLDEEIQLDLDPAAQGEYTFDHALLKTNIGFNDPNRFISCERKKDPLFKNVQLFDYHLDSLSPAINKGIPIGVPFDLDGIPRDQSPDLGAFEFR